MEEVTKKEYLIKALEKELVSCKKRKKNYLVNLRRWIQM